MFCTVLAAAPFCVIDEVADGDEKPVSTGALLESSTCHDTVLAAAPSLQVGVVMLTLAGAAPSTVVSTPRESKPSVPVLSENGVPAVPPVTSAPSAVRS